MRLKWMVALLFALPVFCSGEKSDEDLAPPAGVTAAEPKSTPAPMSDTDITSHVLPRGLEPTDQAVMSLFYNAHRRSQIDPCGCVTGPQGGLDREARLIDHVEKLGLPDLKLDAGGFLKDNASENAQQTSRFILQGLDAMGYKVCNVSYMDLSAGKKFVTDYSSTGTMKFVSANIIDLAGKPMFSPYEVIPVKLRSGQEIRFGVIGVTRDKIKRPTKVLGSAEEKWVVPQEALSRGMGDAKSGTDSSNYRIQDMAEALKKYVPELRGKCDVVVLLAYEKRDQTEKLLAKLVPGATVDLAIAGDFDAHSDKINNAAGGARLVSAGFEGRQVGCMLLKFENAKIIAAVNHLAVITQAVPPLASITPLLLENKAVTKKRSGISPEKLEAESGTQAYLGAEGCQECHKAQFTQWESTRHSKAMKTLLAKNQQFNNDCLKCHVTGYRTENGFTDYRSTPQMGNVQCEVCHGPGYAHTVDKRKASLAAQMKRTYKPDTNVKPMVVEMNREFCVQCHDQQNDPAFDFSRDIQLVNHSRVAQRPDDSTTTRSANHI